MTRKSLMPMYVSCVLVPVVLCAGAAASSEPPASGESGVNRVLTLDGESEFVRVPDAPALHAFTEALTMELWFKASSFYSENGQVNSLLRKNIWAGQENFFVRFRTVDGAPWLEVSAGINIGTLRAYHEFKTGQWYHLAGTYDGSAMVAYINGTKIDSMSASGQMAIDGEDLVIAGRRFQRFADSEAHGVGQCVDRWIIDRNQPDGAVPLEANG